MNKRFWLLIMASLVMLSVVACKGSNGSSQHETSTDEGRKYSVYYINDNKFSTVDYYTETTDTAELVNELLGEMGLMDVTNDVKDVSVRRTNVSNGIAYIYFNEAYSSMTNVYEVLFRASVVKTLSQLTEVNYVYFYIENTALTYTNGQIVGLMSEADFIADSDSNLQNLAWDTITLYFAGADGKSLVEQQVDVAYVKTVSKERLVVEQLIQGPDDDTCMAVINPQVKILSVTTTNSICYVNLDASFAEQKSGVPFEVTLYSIVNSLCELENVSKVQFQINGDSHLEVNGFTFDAYYTRNRDLIYKEVLQ